MITIWKYEIPIEDGNFSISMPVGSKILSFQVQKGTPMIWCRVNTDLDLIKRVFKLYGTGHPFENKDGKYIGSIQLYNGDLIFHLFEKEVNQIE